MFQKSLRARLSLHALNVAAILFLLFPLMAVTFGAFQSERALKEDVFTLVPQVTWDNFLVIVTKGEQKGRIFDHITYLPDNIKSFYTAFGNSTIVALSVTALTLIFGSLSAYTIVRMRIRWTLWFLQANLIARFVPLIVLMIPLYVLMRNAGMLNSLAGVIMAEVGFLLPYAILILGPYFAQFPRELEDAARIDGCTRFTAFWRVILPLSTPGLTACGVIMFVISWENLLIPLILTSHTESMTLPVVIASLVGNVHIFFGLMMAICLLALLPTVVLVLLLQKYVVSGLAAGAVKG